MTLTEFSYYFRRALPFVVIVTIVAIVILTALSSFLRSRDLAPKPLVYSKSFGAIDPITFTVSLEFPESPKFILDNIEGRPVTATSAAQVYFVPKPRTRFGYLENMYLMAKGVDIDTSAVGHTIEGSEGVFDDGNKSLRIDVQSANFKFKRNYEQADNLFQNTILPDSNKIEDDAKAFIEKLRYPDILKQGNIRLHYFHYDSATNDFLIVDNPSEANVVEVDFFRPDMDSLPMVTPKYFTSPNFVVIAYPAGLPTVIRAEMSLYEPELHNPGFYPIKTGDEAWQDLVNKKGVIIANSNPSSTIKVTDMYVAYYDSDMYQTYMEPVYVFLGNNNFVAYVPAIRDEDIKNTLIQPQK